MLEIYTPEFDQDKISTFSAEQRKALEDKGYLIYRLTGKSIASLRNAGHAFFSTWHQGNLLEREESLLTDVAFNPKNFFLPESNTKIFSEQWDMIDEFAKVISKEIPGVTAIMGGVSDYAELTFSHAAATGEYLFGKECNHDYALTATWAGNNEMAIIGYFVEADGLEVDSWYRDACAQYVSAAPLIVPTSAVNW